jgi:succinate dehydrogenase / fumarate reductase cytochrome b subunit
MGQKEENYVLIAGGFVPKNIVSNSLEEAQKNRSQLFIKNKTDIFRTSDPQIKMAQIYKDLHKITFDFFRIEKNKLGLVFTILYVLAMGAVGFHLWHGFQSAFQSLGINNKTWTPRIQLVGKLFAVLVPLLFAIIPICIHFKILVK